MAAEQRSSAPSASGCHVKASVEARADDAQRGRLRDHSLPADGAGGRERAPIAEPAIGAESEPRLQAWFRQPDEAEAFVGPIVTEQAFGRELRAAVGPPGRDQFERAAARTFGEAHRLLGEAQRAGPGRRRRSGGGAGGGDRRMKSGRQGAAQVQVELAGPRVDLGREPAAFADEFAADMLDEEGALRARGHRGRAPEPAFGDADGREAALGTGQFQPELDAVGGEDLAGEAVDLQRHVLGDERALGRQQVAAGMEPQPRVRRAVLQQPTDRAWQLDRFVAGGDPEQAELARQQQAQRGVRQAAQEASRRRTGRARVHRPVSSSSGMRTSARAGVSRNASESASSRAIR